MSNTARPPLAVIPLEAIRAARERLEGLILRTPLVRLELEPQAPEIWLKLECLQPIGSFKLRGAGNAMLALGPGALAQGVCTASAGNMGQGVAWHARRMGVACRVLVPDHAPLAKLEALERLGATVVRVPFSDWWQAFVAHECGIEGRFIHPVCDADVIAGNGTIGLEILEDLPDVDTVVVPWGGGGLACGIAAAIRALRPATRILAAELETAAPLAASLAAGEPRDIDHRPSFVDGIGGRSVLAQMWPMTRELIAGAVAASLDEIASAVRLLVERAHVVAEGAGATAVAAALAGRAGSGKVVCIVSGGNIDAAKLARILVGQTP